MEGCSRSCAFPRDDGAATGAVDLTQTTGAISIEAESLVKAAEASHGRVDVQNMQPFGPGWSGNAQLFWGAPPLGATLSLAFTITASGRYQVVLHFTRAPDFAIVRASIDNAAPISFNGRRRIRCSVLRADTVQVGGRSAD